MFSLHPPASLSLLSARAPGFTSPSSYSHAAPHCPLLLFLPLNTLSYLSAHLKPTVLQVPT